MPSVTIKTGVTGDDGREEVLHEYLCDWANCPNIAEHAVGVVIELRASVVLCAEHAAALRARGRKAA